MANKSNAPLVVRDLCKKASAFQLFHEEFRDIFEGEAFSNAEREYLERNFLENEALDKVSEMVDNVAQRLGISPDGTIMKAPAEKKTRAEKQEWGNDFALEKSRLMEETYEKTIPELLKAKEQKEKEADAKPKEFKAASELYGRLLGKISKIERTRYDKEKNIRYQKGLSIDQIRERILTLALDSSKAFDRVDHELTLTKQLMDCISNKGDFKALSNEAKVFAADNGFELLDEKEVNEARLREEQRWMEENFTFTDVKDVKIRLYVNKWNNEREGQLSEDQQERWNERFHAKAGGFYDIRCFQHMLRPVRKDASGALLKGYEENEKLNDKDIEDFISGDSEKMFRVMHDIGARIAKIELPEEKLTWEYLEEHFEELYEKFQLVFEFENMYNDFADFFESDAFTQKEQDSIRHLMKETRSTYIQEVSQFLTAKGFGQQVKPMDGKTVKEQSEKIIETAKLMFEAISAEDEEAIKDEEKIKLKYQEKGDEVRALSRLWAGQKGMLRDYHMEVRLIDQEIKSMTQAKDQERQRASSETLPL